MRDTNQRKSTMKETNEEKERIKKTFKHGVISQKMMTFRIDHENVEWLEKQVNKGRYINNLIERDRLHSDV